ncbi:MAG TPA: aspartate aminotransferase family protein [Gaiellaceae bacterium]|nr:aspartate aminotransferase family protein [Gaiellaceae bacterium]
MSGELAELLASRTIDALDGFSEYVNPQMVRVLRTIGFDRRWARAEGAYLFDDEGNRYLDWLGGFGMFNVGRNNARVREWLVEAMELETPSAPQMGVSPLTPLLAEELVRRAPASIGKALFTSSGTESVEAALKLGRAATRRQRIVCVEHAFHGLTLGSLSVNGEAAFTDRFGPYLPGIARVPFNDLGALEAELAREDVAVFIVEPILGKGVHLPEAGYLEGAQELCRRYGTLFCVDEVQTGFGRTGRLFAGEHWGLEPDLMPVAKSLSGGYVPVGALLMSDRVYEAVFDSLENAFSHGSTFAPNDLACVAGLATLRELDERRLLDRSARLGELLLDRTRVLGERYPVVKDVRGLGLMWAIEFGEPAARSATWRMLERVQPGIFAQLIVVPLFTEHRILSQVAGHRVNIVKGLPPLTIGEDDLDWFANALDAVVRDAQKLGRSMTSFALRAARAGRRSRAAAPVG